VPSAPPANRCAHAEAGKQLSLRPCLRKGQEGCVPRVSREQVRTREGGNLACSTPLPREGGREGAALPERHQPPMRLAPHTDGMNILPGRAQPSQTLPPGGGMGKPCFPIPLAEG